MLGSAGRGVFIIRDDDPTPTITPGNTGINPEGDSGSTFWSLPLTLSNPPALPVSIDWTTFDNGAPGIATGDVDYVADAGTVTFAPGETTQHVQLEALGDTTDEPPLLWGEWGLVSYSNPTNASLDTSFFGLGVFIVIDDD